MTTRPSSKPGWRELTGRKPVLAWALYDCGNSAFVTSVVVGFFPLLFNEAWSVDADGAATTARLMTVNGIASLLLAIAAPVLGAIADVAARRKLLLGCFAAAGAVATGLLGGVPQGAWLYAALLFGIASVAFAAANIFYDSLLIDVTTERRFDRVSAFGFSFGYAGGGILLAVHVVMIFRPAWFGIADADTAVRLVFLTVAGWWLLFTVPLLLYVGESAPAERPPVGRAIREGLGQLANTLRRIRKFRPAAVFLVAYWLYVDGVNTIMKVAIDFGYKVGVDRADLLVALIVVQFISLPAALLFGWLGERFGAKRGLLGGLAIYITVTVWAGFLDSAVEFYVLACAIGVAQGGVFSLSRSYFADLIPEGQAAEFFGFYNMVGKLAAVLGPFLVAGAATLTGSTRSAVVAILPLLLLGAALLVINPRGNDAGAGDG